MGNRVSYHGDQLDEVVTDAGVHLEHLGGKQWFLSCERKDGSAFAIWFSGKITYTEEREPPTCRECGASIRPDMPTDGMYIMCSACGWSARPSDTEGEG